MLNQKFNYDKKNDILYISFGEAKPAYGDEIQEGIILRKDFVSDEIIGITILDFLKKLNSQDKELENLSKMHGLESIDFKAVFMIN